MGLKEGLKHLFRETSAEIAALGVAGAILAGVPAYKHESARANLLPLAFSEKHQIHNDASYKGETVPPFTEYLTSVNDASMKIFEAWNLSRQDILDKTDKFAMELEIKIDPALNYHHFRLDKLLAIIPAEGQAALDLFKPFLDVNNGLKPVNAHFDRSWRDTHVDNYHTETYEETVTDADGNTHTETRTRQVYDDTTHTYTYNKAEGEAAAISLIELLAKNPNLQFAETLKIASQTNAEGEYAIEKTLNKNKNKRMSPFDFMQYSTLWNRGSTLKANLPVIMDMWAALQNDSPAWASAKAKARSVWYKTCSHSDAGPKEFQIAEKTLTHGTQMVSSIDEIAAGITYTQEHAPHLNRLLEQFVSVTRLHRPIYQDLSKRPGKLAGQIMKEAKEIYQKNIKAGLDVQGFRWPLFVMALLLGTAAGGALGFWIDKIGDERGWWEGKEEHYSYRPFVR